MVLPVAKPDVERERDNSTITVRDSTLQSNNGSNRQKVNTDTGGLNKLYTNQT